MAGALLGMGMLPAGLVWAVSRSALPLLLTLLAVAIAASGTSFLRRGNARDVLLVGGSLAGVQAVTPMGGLLAALLIPVLAGMPKSPGAVARQSGLYLLLFFLPVLAALGLAYFARAGIADPVAAFRGLQLAGFSADAPPPRAAQLALAGASMLIAVPALIGTLAKRERRTVLAIFPALVGSAVVAADLIATALGAIREPSALAAPLAATSLLGMFLWPRQDSQSILGAAVAGLVLSALYVLAVVPFVWMA